MRLHPNKRPAVSRGQGWHDALVRNRAQIDAHDGLFGIYHSSSLACIDVDDNADYRVIVELFHQHDVAYAIERSPRGWHIWHGRNEACRYSGVAYTYKGIKGEIRSWNCYTAVYDTMPVVEFALSDPQPAPLGLYATLTAESPPAPSKRRIKAMGSNAFRELNRRAFHAELNGDLDEIDRLRDMALSEGMMARDTDRAIQSARTAARLVKGQARQLADHIATDSGLTDEQSTYLYAHIVFARSTQARMCNASRDTLAGFAGLGQSRKAVMRVQKELAAHDLMERLPGYHEWKHCISGTGLKKRTLKQVLPFDLRPVWLTRDTNAFSKGRQAVSTGQRQSETSYFLSFVAASAGGRARGQRSVKEKEP